MKFLSLVPWTDELTRWMDAVASHFMSARNMKSFWPDLKMWASVWHWYYDLAQFTIGFNRIKLYLKNAILSDSSICKIVITKLCMKCSVAYQRPTNISLFPTIRSHLPSFSIYTGTSSYHLEWLAAKWCSVPNNITHYDDITWASWCLTLAQQLAHANNKGSIKLILHCCEGTMIVLQLMPCRF